MTPQIRLPPAASVRITQLDRRADELFDHLLRGRPGADRLFYAASAAGDHGLLWMGLAGVQALRRREDRWRRPLLRAVVGLGLESVVVNGPVKWMFRRQRPVQVGPRPRHLRQPRTSSFPSGHASAAFYGAAVLRDNDPLWPAYYVIAVAVAASRVHVHIHHASDVIGGIMVGTLLGELTRRLVPLDQAAS